MENSKEGFSYVYSAKEQEEIKNIRKKYAAKEEDKMERLRRLDEGVTWKAQTVSLTVGIIGTLILGLGMSLAMTELAELLGIYQDMGMLFGVMTGLVGIVLVCCAYPIYNRIVRKERQKIAPEIIRLTDELLK